MQGQDGGTPSRRSSLPPSLHLHLRSAPQSSRSASGSATVEQPPILDSPDEDTLRVQSMEFAFQGPATTFPLRPIVPPLSYIPTSLERVPSLPPLRREASPEQSESLTGSGDDHLETATSSSIHHGSAARLGAASWSTDPAFYTYPPPTPRYFPPQSPSHWAEGEAGPSSWSGRTASQQQEFFNLQSIDVDEPWDSQSTPSRWSAQRLGRAESYTRADDWESQYTPRRSQIERRVTVQGDYRGGPSNQPESYSRFSLSPQEPLRPPRPLPEIPGTRLAFENLSSSPEESGLRFGRGIPSSPVTLTRTVDPQSLPSGLASLDDPYASPLVEPALLRDQQPYTGSAPSPDASRLSQSLVDSDELGSGKKTVVRKGKRQRKATEEEDQEPLLGSERPSAKRAKLKKKTEVACNFCRMRKLGCSGERPECASCIARGQRCEYESAPRRRGPGKAPRGSRKPPKPRVTPARSRSSPATTTSAVDRSFDAFLTPGVTPPLSGPASSLRALNFLTLNEHFQTPGGPEGFDLALPRTDPPGMLPFYGQASRDNDSRPKHEGDDSEDDEDRSSGPPRPA